MLPIKSDRLLSKLTLKVHSIQLIIHDYTVFLIIYYRFSSIFRLVFITSIRKRKNYCTMTVVGTEGEYVSYRTKLIKSNCVLSIFAFLTRKILV